MKLLKNKINLLLILSLLTFSITGNTEDYITESQLRAGLEAARQFNAEKESQDAIFIEKNVPAPYSGILFTESKAREIRSDLLESGKYQIRLESELSKTQSLFSVIELKQSEIELYKTQNQRLIKQAETSDTMKYVWFGLGILATGVAVYGARGLAK